LPRTNSHRRDFLGQLAGGAAALAGLGLNPRFANAQQFASRASMPQSDGKWDDSWTARLDGKLNTVFDSPQINGALALFQARVIIDNYRDVIGIGPEKLGLVVVLRHRAVPMAFNDVIWNKYEVGESLKLDDPSTGKHAQRNPFINVSKDDTHGLVGPEQSIDTLRDLGVIFLGCNRAAQAWASRLAKKAGTKAEDVHEELKAHLIPGVTLLPTGIFAVVRAQNAGCCYMPSWYSMD
jgi:hypothetical protein